MILYLCLNFFAVTKYVRILDISITFKNILCQKRKIKTNVWKNVAIKMTIFNIKCLTLYIHYTQKKKHIYRNE